MNDSPPLVIANLKANKTWDEMAIWIDHVGQSAKIFAGTVVVCPTFPFLAATHQKITTDGLNLKLGSQNVSQFEQGAYTGEVAASQIADLCRYVILGHSERRQNFNESDEMLEKKVQNSLTVGLIPIFCIQGEETKIPQEVTIVAYEPVFAIGTGNPDTPQNAINISRKIKSKGAYTVIYGGSVLPQNVKSYLKKDVLDGVIVATNSLDPQNFIKVLESATF